MSETDIIFNCAPTLAGLKTGSSFVCSYESEPQLLSELRSVNRKLVSRGVRAIPLRQRGGRALIYVFRPDALSRDLDRADACAILAELGYHLSGWENCVTQLAQRVRSPGGFPHEIGLFLGYPPEDVRGFMEQGACGQKYTGCWKVYGDWESARIRFDQYRKCTRVYRDCWARGTTLERLTVKHKQFPVSAQTCSHSS